MDIKLVKKFAKEPTIKNAKKLDKSIQMLFYSYSSYVIENKIGDIQKAKLLRNILLPEINKDICMDRRGVKSIILGCKFLIQLNSKKNISLDIYINNLRAFRVYYNSDPQLPNMFLITQTYDLFGIDKELNLYYEGLVDYFKNIFLDFSDIRINNIKLHSSNGENKDFYNKDIGVFWGNEKCAKCTISLLNGNTLTEECKKMIDNKCYEKFRHSPELVFKDIHEKKKPIDYKELIKLQKKQWECDKCFLYNPPETETCLACLNKK